VTRRPPGWRCDSILGGVELPAQPQDLALLVERRAGGCSWIPSVYCRHALPALRQRVGPCALELQDLRAMHATRRVKTISCRWSWHQRLARPSTRERGRAWTLAAVDHAAVDETGHHRSELAGRDRDHRLVEKREPLLEAPHLEEGPSLDVACGGD
jgi:hypothetical protein